jgi:hypothetical protein
VERSRVAHHDLPFDDCAHPPDAAVAAFFRVVDAAPGAVAVTIGMTSLFLFCNGPLPPATALYLQQRPCPGPLVGLHPSYTTSQASKLLPLSIESLIDVDSSPGLHVCPLSLKSHVPEGPQRPSDNILNNISFNRQ